MNKTIKRLTPPVSEGTKSAQAILNGYMVLPRPTTKLEFQLQENSEHAEQQRVRKVLGPSGCTQDCDQGRACTCKPAVRKRSYLSRFTGWLVSAAVLCIVLIAQWIMGDER